MEVKGISIKNCQDWVLASHSEADWEALVDALPEDSRKELTDYSVFSGKWYPVTVFEDVNKYIIDRWGKGDHRIIFRIAREGAVRNLKSVYRIFMKVASPAYVLKKTAVMYRQFYNYGEMKVVQDTVGDVIIELHDVPDQRIIFERISGYMEGVLLATKATDPKAVFEYLPDERKTIFNVVYK